MSSATISRPRLTNLLDSVWSHPLTIVSAPAGYGKTTSIRLWEMEREHTLAWLTLDEADDDLERFVSLFFTTLQTNYPDLSLNALDLFARPSRPDKIELAGTLADDLADSSEQMLVVLDECETVSSADIWLFVETLIQWSPPNFHLVLLTRTDPALPLARLKMRGAMLELRVADLQFTSEEVGSLLAIQSESVTTEVIDGLFAMTHGWAAGVRLASLAFRGDAGQPDRIRAAMEGQAHILELLVEEVLRNQPPDVQEALLACSVPDSISPPLLAAMTDADPIDCHATLETIRRNGLSTSHLTQDISSYTLHALFRELLSNQLRAWSSVEKVAELQRRCSLWYWRNGETDLAIRHGLQAGDQEQVIQWLELAVPGALEREDWRSAHTWLRNLPEEVILEHPNLALGWCWTLYFRGQWRALASYRETVRARVEQGNWSDVSRQRWIAEINALVSIDILTQIGAAEKLLKLVDQEDFTFESNRRFAEGHFFARRARAMQFTGREEEAVRELRKRLDIYGSKIDAGYSRIAIALVLVYRQMGEFPDAERIAHDSLELMQESGLPVGTNWMRTLLGVMAFDQNNFEAAEAALGQVVSEHREAELLAVRESMLLLVRLNIAKHQIVEADGILRRAREILVDAGASELLPDLQAVDALLALASGDRERAMSWALSATNVFPDESPEFTTPPSIIGNRILSEINTDASHRQGLALATRFLEKAERMHSRFRIPQVLAMQSISLHALGQQDLACAKMELALQHAAAPYTTRSFIDLGPQLADVLNLLRSRGFVSGLLEQLLDHMSSDGPTVTDVVFIANPRPSADAKLLLLTDRELAVLERLDRRLSYKEIGNELFISPLTVKRHASNIYDKLGSENRREAVATARALGWTASH